MQPQETPSPSSPNPQYDFILKDQPKPKRSFKIPTFGLPRAAAVALVSTLGLFLIIILAHAVLGGKTTNADALIKATARAQEVVRVSKLVEPLAHNSDTQGLVATTEAALTSDQTQITAYLKRAKIKAGPKNLTIYLNKNTDAQMQAAGQNNSLDSAYASYLKQSLISYKADLQLAAKGASKLRLQILNRAFQSTSTLLSAPQLASAGS
jgi:hypothetical protein